MDGTRAERREGWLVGLTLCALLLAASAIAVLALRPGSTPTLSEREAKETLRRLPYDFRFRPVPVPAGARGAIAGIASGPHETTVEFAVSLGPGHNPVPLPGAVPGNATGGKTFRITETTLIRDSRGKLIANPELATRSQWNESARMITAIEDALCRATEGDHCPI